MVYLQQILSPDLKYSQPSLDAMENLNVSYLGNDLDISHACMHPFHIHAVHDQEEELRISESLCSQECNCLKQISSDISQIAEHFSRIDDPPEDIAVALFNCVESMQCFNYGGL